MNRNTVQRSPRGGVGVGGHCSLPGGRPCGMRGRGAPGLAPPLCGHSSLAAGQAGPRCMQMIDREKVVLVNNTICLPPGDAAVAY